MEITPNAFFPNRVPNNPNPIIHAICRDILTMLSPNDSVPMKIQHGMYKIGRAHV